MIKSYCLSLFLFFTGITICLVESKAQDSKIDSLSALLKLDQDDTVKVNHLNELAIYFMYNNPDTSITLTTQALNLANSLTQSSDKNVQISSQKAIIRSTSNLGSYYGLVGKHVEAFSYHLKALELRSSINDKSGVAVSLGNIAIIYSRQGDYPKALDYIFRSLFIHLELGDKRSVALALAQIGSIYYKANDYHSALTYSLKALPLFLELGLKPETATLYINLGASYYALHDYKKSFKYYELGIKLSEEIGNKRAACMQLSNVGNIYQDQEKYDLATEYYNRSLKVAEELNDPYLRATNLYHIGKNFMRQEKFQESEKLLTEAYNISKEIGTLDLTMETTRELSQFYETTNKFKQAYDFHIEYMEVKDSLFNEEKSKEIGKLEARQEMEKAEMEQLAKEEAERKSKMDAKNRKDLLQYSGIILLLLFVGLLVGVLGFLKVKPMVATGISFFTFLLVFEFMLVLLDPYIDKYSSGEPAFKLLFNAIIAALIFPIHTVCDKVLRKRLVKRDKKA